MQQSEQKVGPDASLIGAGKPGAATSRPGSEAFIYEVIARDIVPDPLLRMGVQNMLKLKLKEEFKGTFVKQQAHIMSMVQELKSSPIAIETASANEQHYQVPTEFFKLCLGKRLKYSCAYYKNDSMSLDQAEEAMLALTVERARIKNGHNILELGCGWGSLTLYMAEHFPQSKITAVSNSATQRQYIEIECARLGFKNVQVITCDMNVFQFDGQVDRVISVEMFEHMKNYQLLLQKISSWLSEGGLLFVHIFSHKLLCYHYQDQDGSDWLTRNFFAGGIMPSHDLLLYFQENLKIEQQWAVNGTHYERTANHWLANMDKNKSQIMPILAATYGPGQSVRWWAFWRLFFIACAELWGFDHGEEWMVSHYLFKKTN